GWRSPQAAALRARERVSAWREILPVWAPLRSARSAMAAGWLLGIFLALLFFLLGRLAPLAVGEHGVAHFVESRLEPAALHAGDVGNRQRHFELRHRQG